MDVSKNHQGKINFGRTGAGIFAPRSTTHSIFLLAIISSNFNYNYPIIVAKEIIGPEDGDDSLKMANFKEVNNSPERSTNSKANGKNAYSSLLLLKRKEQSAAVKSILKLQDAKKKTKLLRDLTNRMKESILESKDVLIKADVMDFQDLPEDETLRENAAKVIENAAFFAEIALYFPDFAHKYSGNDANLLSLFRWAYSFSAKYSVYDEATQKMMELAAQELNLMPRQEDFVNPYRYIVQKEDIQKKQQIRKAMWDRQLTLEMLQKRMDGGRMDLSSLRLNQIPIELMCRCAGRQRIRQLDLSNNLLTAVPPQFAQMFPDVRVLDLRTNKIKRLPENIGALISLQRLDLSHNQIKKLPNSFAELEELKWLNLADNPLEQDLVEIVGSCSTDAECSTAAKRAVQYIHFSATLSSESTAIADDSAQFSQNDSISSSESNDTTTSESQKIFQTERRKKYKRQDIPPRHGDSPSNPNTCFFFSCSSGTIFVSIMIFLTILGVPIWLTFDSMRGACVSGPAIIARTMLAKRPEERRFCAQLANSIMNGTFPSSFGQFFSDFTTTFREHWSQSVNERLVEKIPPEMLHFQWWSDRFILILKFTIWIFWQIVEPIITFVMDYFNDLWFSYIIPFTADWR